MRGATAIAVDNVKEEKTTVGYSKEKTRRLEKYAPT